MLKVYTTTILILLESKTHNNTPISLICSYSHVNSSIWTEANGFVGGIWVLWDDNEINLEEVAMDDQVIMAIILNKQKVEWVLIVVYASPNYMLCTYLWEFLQKLGKVITSPWLLISDWNQVLSPEDKQGGRATSNIQMRQTFAMVTKNNLLDLGFLKGV